MENLLLKALISVLIGALVGIEREHRARKTIFAGFRTFMLVSLFGFLTGYFSEKFSLVFAFISLITVSGLAHISYLVRFQKRKSIGLTTEIAFVLTFLIGFILYYEEYPYVFSIFLAILLTAILYAKETLHSIARKATSLEIRDLIIFVLVAFVVYPLLPNQTFDPWNALNPKLIWKGIVVILGLSYFSYLTFKIFKSRGLILNSFFAGLINSMFVSYEYSLRCSKYPRVKYLLLIAVSSMVLRAFLLGSIINFKLISWLSPLLLTSAIGYGIGIIKGKERNCPVKIKSPLSFKFALFYGMFFATIVLLAKIISSSFGSYGIYLLTLLAGLVDVSSLTIALAIMPIPPIIIARGILILVTANILGNWLMTMLFGSKKFAKEAIKIEIIPLLLNSVILTFSFLI